jgi:hypothetical protein
VTFGDRDRVGFSAWSTDGVYADPCQWQANLIELTDPVLPDDAGRVEQVVQLLIEQPNREPSVPSEVRIDDWGATMVELSVPEDLDLANCDLRRYNAWTDVSDPTGGNWNHQPGQSDIVYVVDMDRDPVILHAWLRAGATAEDRAELEAMLNSLRVGFPEDFAPSTN